ncbi:hypothetical protein QYF36_012624 [Acer negundo]|nr:hypothetical protein QYF36_012624 [Acer negundo]
MNSLFKNSLSRIIRFHRHYPTQASRGFSRFGGGDLLPESWKSMEGLVRCSANYVPLSPVSFLERTAKVYRDRTSVVYGSLKYTWSQTHQRCLKLASALTQLGICRGDVVATLAPNVPAIEVKTIAIPFAYDNSFGLGLTWNNLSGCKANTTQKVIICRMHRFAKCDTYVRSTNVSHLYGLTETPGLGTYCTWKPEWDALPLEERSRMKARQGI